MKRIGVVKLKFASLVLVIGNPGTSPAKPKTTTALLHNFTISCSNIDSTIKFASVLVHTYIIKNMKKTCRQTLEITMTRVDANSEPSCAI